MNLRTIQKHSEWQKLKKLYKSAFPQYERKPLWMVFLKYLQKEADIWVIEENGAFSGLAITINELDMVLLDYFAISDDKRGAGLGTKALRTLQEHYKGKRFFLEIESIYIPSDNTMERQRRKQFYLRNGMTEMQVMVNAFGTEMELLGYHCKVSYADYYSLYQKSYGIQIAKHLKEAEYPEKTLDF